MSEPEEVEAPPVDPIEEEYGPIFAGLLEERDDIVTALGALKTSFAVDVTATSDAEREHHRISTLQMKSKAARIYHMCASPSPEMPGCALPEARASVPALLRLDWASRASAAPWSTSASTTAGSS